MVDEELKGMILVLVDTCPTCGTEWGICSHSYTGDFIGPGFLLPKEEVTP